MEATLPLPDLTLVNPGYLPWLALIAIPIVIHLLTRRTLRRGMLPTLAMLSRSIARQSKLFRFRRLLLLALRTLALAAIVAVFLRPAATAPFSRTGGNRRVVALVLDVSMSMGYTGAGVSSLARVRSQAAALLDDLRPGDLAYVVLEGSSPTPALPTLSGDFGALRQAVKAAEPTPRRGDPSAAIALAAEQLAKANAGTGELYLASDFQRTNWADVQLGSLPPGVKTLFLQSDPVERSNVAVSGLKLDPPSPRIGDTCDALIDVWNGSGETKTVPVTLTVREPGAVSDDEARTSRASVSVPPFGSATAAIPITLTTAGTYRIDARTPPDGLGLGCARYLTVDTRRGMTVLLISDFRPDRVGTSAYYLSRALNPAPQRTGGIRVVTVRPSQLTATDLGAADAAILDGVVDFPAERAKTLTSWVSTGGGLIVFLSSADGIPVAEGLSNALPSGERLPFTPREPMDMTGQRKDHVRLTEAAYDNPMLKLFKDPSHGDLGEIRFKRFFLTGDADPRAEILLRFEDTAVAAARRTVGAGSILLCNFAPDRSAENDLAVQQLFPPLVHEMVKGMSAVGANLRDFAPGGPASVSIDPALLNGEVSAVGPMGDLERVAVDHATGSVVIEQTSDPGFHLISAAGRMVGTVAVNVSPEELDLRSLNPSDLERSAGDRTAYAISGDKSGLDALERLRRALPLWPYCLAIALIALLAEEALAGTRPRRPARPSR